MRSFGWGRGNGPGAVFSSCSGQIGCGGGRLRALLACVAAGGIRESEAVIAYGLPGRVLICNHHRSAEKGNADRLISSPTWWGEA